MREQRISCATVIHENHNVVGMLSEMDCLKAIMDAKYYIHVDSTVGMYMTKEVESISPETSIIDIAQHLIKNRRRRLPVIEDGKLIGQFSARSILRAINHFDGK